MRCLLSVPFAVAAATVMTAALLSAPVSAQSTKLRAVNNGGILSTASRIAWYEPFSEATGVEVIEDNWSQEYAKLRTQVETGVLSWDVVEVNYNNATLACEEGLLERIDWSKHIDVSNFEAAGGVTDCAVPFMSVAIGIAYDADRITGDAPRTWQDFWNVEKWPGKRGMIYRPSALEVALMADGVAAPDVLSVLSSPGGVDRAFKKLEEIKPYIHWWKGGSESMQILASGEVVMVYAWNGRVASANKNDGRNFRISYDGGFILGNQFLAVMSGSPAKDLAIRFIKYASSPAPIAMASSILNYGPASAAGYDLLARSQVETLPKLDAANMSYQGGAAYDEFWLANKDALTQRLAKWAAQ